MTSSILTLPPTSAEEEKLLRRKYASFPLSKEESLLKDRYDEEKRKVPKDKNKVYNDGSTASIKRSAPLNSEEIKQETIKKLQASLPKVKDNSENINSKKVKVLRRKAKSVGSPQLKEEKIDHAQGIADRDNDDKNAKVDEEKSNENELESETTNVESRSRIHRKMVKQSISFKKGNTVYVTGRGITESLLKKAFEGFGRILSVSMEAEKNCGFVTFDSYESTSRAINDMDNTSVNGVTMKVSYSRRQNFICIPDKVATDSPWARSAAGQMEDIRQTEARHLVEYEDPF